MKRKKVVSSSILEMGYDPKKQHLEVQFKRGLVWRYREVRPEEYESLLSAPSIGSHFHYWRKQFQRPGGPVLEPAVRSRLIKQLRQSTKRLKK